MSAKTLHLTSLFNQQSGGVATFYRALMQRASETGRHMTLVVPGGEWGAEQVSDTVRIRRVPAAHSLIGDRRYRVILPHHFLFPGSTQFKRILEQEQPNVVECCDKYSLFYLLGYYRMGWIDGTRGPAGVALTMERMDDNFTTFLNQSVLSRAFCRWYMGRIYHSIPKYHIAISRYVADELNQAPSAAAKPKTRILPLGVDSVLFRPPSHPRQARQAFRAAAGLPLESNVILYAGRLSPEKNLGLLVDTLHELDHSRDARWHLMMLGDGLLRPQMEKLAATDWRGRLHVLPHVNDRATLARFLGGADVFVHPNPREPFGIGPLEAMACGTPVVLPNCGGVTEYATPDNSWMAAPDGKAFAAAISVIHASPDEATRRAAAARATALSHHWTAVADRYFAEYDAIYEHHQRAPDPWPVPFPHAAVGSWFGARRRPVAKAPTEGSTELKSTSGGTAA
jgi:alpha-1,6-mannosyltransferase